MAKVRFSFPRIFVCALLLLVTSFSTLAQLNEHYFSEEHPKYGAGLYDHYTDGTFIYTAGRATGDYYQMPVVTALDTSGSIVWRTSLDSTDVSSGFVSKLRPTADGYLMALAVDDDFWEAWKIDPASGTVLWKLQLTDLLVRDARLWQDSLLLVSYIDHTSNVGDIRLMEVNINSGTLTNDYYITNSGNTYIYSIQLATRSGHGVLLGYNSTLVSLDTLNMANQLWQIAYPEDSVDNINHLHITPAGETYMWHTRYSTFERGIVSKLNLQDGSLEWWTLTATIPIDVNYRDMELVGDHIYTTWRHTTVGSTTARFLANKINRFSGQIVWENNYSFGTNGSGGARDLALDANEDVYLTGYYNSANFGPGGWGVVKLNGQTGNAEFAETVVYDATLSPNSSGRVVERIGDHVYTCGYLHRFPTSSSATSPLAMAKLDAHTGAEEWQRFLLGEHQSACKLLDIQRWGSNRTVLLKELDLVVEVEVLDNLLNTLWTVRIDSLQLHGFSLKIIDDHQLRFAAYTPQEFVPGPPNEMWADEMHVFHLDDTGSVMKHMKANVESSSLPLAVLMDDTMTTLITNRHYDQAKHMSFGTTWQSWNYTATFPSYWTNFVDEYKLSRNFYHNSTGDEAWLIAYKYSYVTRLYTLTKSTNSISQGNTIPGIFQTYGVQAYGPDHILIHGRGYNQQDRLVRYNYVTEQADWSRSYSGTGHLLHVVHDTINHVLYTAGIADTLGQEHIRLRKLDEQGNLLWTVLHTPTALGGYPNDIALAGCTQSLVVAGYALDSLPWGVDRQVMIARFATSGALVESIVRAGEFGGGSEAYTTAALPNQAVVAGGTLTIDTLGKAGFLWELDTAQQVSAITATGPLSFCQGDSVTLQLPDSSWVWASTGSTGNQTVYGSATISAQQNNPVCPVVSLPVYTEEFAAVAAPAIDAAPLLQICQGDTAIVSSSAAYAYEWATGDTSQAIELTTPGSHWVLAYDSNGCVSDTSGLLDFQVNPLPGAPGIIGSNNTLTSTTATSYQWYFEDTLLVGATQQTYSPVNTGNYSVEIADNNGCTSTSIPYFFQLVGIHPAEHNPTLSVFPNPVSSSDGMLVINLPDVATAEYRIVGITGAVLQNGQLRGRTHVDVSALVPGSYLLEVALADRTVNTLVMVK